MSTEWSNEVKSLAVSWIPIKKLVIKQGAGDNLFYNKTGAKCICDANIILIV